MRKNKLTQSLRHHFATLRNAAGITTLLLASPAIAQTETTEGNVDLQGRKIEIITVTGEKTNRSLRDTTTSVQIFEGIDTAQFLNVSEAIASTLNLTSDPFGVPSIRGVDGSGAALGVFSIMGGSQPRVSTIVDGKAEPFFAATSGDSGMWDVKRIEVLRGPQSTIQGRNSIGGAIVVTTNDPTFETEAAVRTAYRDIDGSWETSAMFSAPIIEDELAFRVTAQHTEGESFIDFPVPEGAPDYPWDPKAFDATNITAKLLWQPKSIEGFTAKLTIKQREETGVGFKNMVSGPDFSKQEMSYEQSSAARNQNTDNDSYMLDFSYALSDNWMAELKLAQTDYQWDFHEFGSFMPSLPGAPEGVNNQNKVMVDEESKTWDARLIYTNDQEDVSAFIGVYHYEREQSVLRLAQDFRMNYIPPQPECSPADCPLDWGNFLTIVTPITTGNLFEEFDVTGNTDVDAIYVEVDFAVNEDFNVIVGGRYEQDDQSRGFGSDSFFFSSFAEKRDESVFLPKVSMTYDVNDDTTLGFSAGKGYTAGGYAISFTFGVPSEPYTYESETAWTYELSARSTLLDNTTFLSANVFYSNYDDYQQTYGFKVDNIDEAHTYGLELEVTSLVTDDLELVAGLGLLSTEVDSAETLDPTLKGNELTHAPERTAMLGINYHINEQFSLDWKTNYVSEYYSTNGIMNEDNRVVGNYVVSNIALNYNNESLDVRVYVNNAFDREFIYNLSGSNNAQIAYPRSLGVSGTYRF